MKKYKGYLIDLDGTMYLGNERIEAASEFIDALREKNIPHLFVTNNSTKRPEQVAEKLNDMGIKADTDQIFTTSMATANYIKQQKEDAKVYAIGEDGLDYALKSKGLQRVEDNADFVVIGMDRQINYEKLAIACLNVRAGAKFISTNGDIMLPTERGMLPGNGSLTSVITVSTGTQPQFIGKPEPIIMEMALKSLGYTKEETLMVGDNYETDILAGIHAGMDTLLVFTGVTKEEQLKDRVTPTFKINTLEEWIDKL